MTAVESARFEGLLHVENIVVFFQIKRVIRVYGFAEFDLDG